MLVKDLKLEATLQAIPGILYRADTPPRFVTRFICAEHDPLLCYQPEEFIGSDWAWEDCFWEEDKARVLAEWQAFMDSGRCVGSFDYRLWKKDRKGFCWIRDRVSLIRDEAGQPVELYGVMVDVTEAREISIELETQRRIIDKIFLAAPIGIGMSVNRIFIHVNQGLCQMLGYAKEELIGQDSMIIYQDPEEYNRVGEILYPPDGNGRIQTVDSLLRSKSGDKVYVTMNVLPIDGISYHGGVVYTITDITHIKKIQEELEIATGKAMESERLKFAFIANKMH